MFELSILRDARFAEPWKYVAGMFLIGLVYVAWMLARRPQSPRAPDAATAPAR